MAVPAEDVGPAWLREYGGTIEADITRMEQFAAALDAEVRDHYIPHMQLVREDMLVELPPPLESFPELHTFLQTHRVAQQSTSDLVYTVADATGGFAYAAQKVSENYSDADAFAAAQVGEIEAALDETKAARRPAAAEGR
nr:hypothetical protein [Micromonospora sp. DSM 115978]